MKKRTKRRKTFDETHTHTIIKKKLWKIELKINTQREREYVLKKQQSGAYKHFRVLRI